jgi:uncharacterized protein YndB with AHSA1/START domain
MSEILHATVVAADPAAVRTAVTTSDGLAGFWTDQVRAEPVVGTEAWFGFGPEAAIQFRFDVTGIADDAVEWRCTDGPDEWVGTQVRWGFQSSEQGTSVRFEHSGWRSADGDLARCSFVWGQVLARLDRYLATGTPDPYFHQAG